jgi:hypothetical protein
MNVPALGELTPDPDFDNFPRSRPVPIPLFGNQALPFTIFVEGQDWAVTSAIEALLHLGVAERTILARDIFDYYLEMKEALGEEQLGCRLHSPDQVWSHVSFREIFVYNEQSTIYLMVVGGCDWEIEHGLQLVFEDGKDVVRVSGHDGHLS